MPCRATFTGAYRVATESGIHIPSEPDMPEAPFIEDDSGELWVRDGEVYIPDRNGLFKSLGCVALLHSDSAVMGLVLVLGKGWVPVGDLAKQAGKPVLEAVK